ncbi:MAG: dephospho-CoA kinase [Gammaproteobacteria bacterium]
MLIIGLTGGIGSGKTTVAKLFSALGVPVIDTDEIARQLTQPGQPLLQTLRQQFGPAVFNPDGSLDRSALAQQVFNNTPARQQLEALLHPAIWQAAERQIQALDDAYCLLVVPLLIESGATGRVDRILVVDTSEDLQVYRTRQRDQRSEADIQAILAAQVDRQTRLTAADDIIDNSEQASLPLVTQVKALHEKYLALAQTTSPITS